MCHRQPPLSVRSSCWRCAQPIGKPEQRLQVVVTGGVIFQPGAVVEPHASGVSALTWAGLGGRGLALGQRPGREVEAEKVYRDAVNGVGCAPQGCSSASSRPMHP